MERTEVGRSRALVIAASLALLLLGVAAWIMQGPASEPGEPPAGSVQDAALGAQEVFFEGKVIDGESLAGVPGAAVEIEGGGRLFEAVADDTGAFKVLAPGVATRWSLRARAQGHRPDVGDAQVTASGGDRLEGLQVKLWREGVLKGRVLHRGAGVPGARLSLIRIGDDAQPEAVEGATGADGRFEVVTRPGRLRLLAQAEGLAQGESREVALVGGKVVAGLDIDLTERGGLLVTVQAPDGAPVAGAFVDPIGVPSWRGERQRTDEQGQLRFEGLPVGPLEVRVWAQRFSEVRQGPVTIEAEVEAALTVTLEPLRGVLGRVVGPDGEGVRGARVALWPSGQPGSVNTSHTGPGGVFRFVELDAGSYELSATHPRFGASPEVRAQAGGEEPVVLELAAGGEIAGVVSSPDGEPVQRFTVVIDRFVPEPGVGVDPTPLGARNFGRHPQQDARGAFLVEQLAPGTYDLHVDAPDFGPGRAEGVRVRAGRRTEGVRVTLTRGATLAGRVLDASTRAPIEGAAVAIRDSARRERLLGPLRAVTDAQGEFLLEGLEPGRRSLVVTRDGYSMRIAAGIQIGDRDQEDLEISLEPVPEGEKPKMEFFGIGATLGATPQGTVEVKSLLDGAPASTFGLRAGDEILAVDGQDVRSLGLGRAVELIRGEEGVGVSLEVRRNGEPYPFKVDIERGRVVFDIH